MEDPTIISNDPVVIDDTVNDEEEDIKEKEYLVRLLGLFFMLQRCGNDNFVNEDGRATKEYSNIHACNERLRTIGIALATLNRDIRPSIVKICDKVLRN